MPGLNQNRPGERQRPEQSVAVSAVSNARYLARNLLGTYDVTARLLQLRPSFADRLVDRATDVCIEGFPRSGNSFLLKAFTTWNPGARVAHHLHVAAQVRRAVRFGIPCLVLVRRPEDAVTSLLVADPALDAGIVLASYTALYDRVLACRDHVVVARFEDAVARPWEPVGALNRRFGTSFHAHVLSTAEREAIEDALRTWNERDGQPPMLVAVPSPQKERRKRAILPVVGGHPRLLAAVETYERLVGS